MPALTAKRYKNRPSPPFHAGDYKGETKTGNDGKLYESKADSRGVYRWVRRGDVATAKRPRREAKLSAEASRPRRGDEATAVNEAKRKTKKTKKSKVSKRVQAMMDDPANPLGKNPELQAFWQSLASSEKVVLIYKDGSNKIITPPTLGTKKRRVLFESFEADPSIVAVLSSAMSWDAYDRELFPKAKDKTVAEVLASWKKFFKPLEKGKKLCVTY